MDASWGIDMVPGSQIGMIEIVTVFPAIAPQSVASIRAYSRRSAVESGVLMALVGGDAQQGVAIMGG